MKLPKSFYSWTTAIGAAIATISGILFIFLLIVTFIFGEGSGYTGIVIYIILPVFVILGGLMIPIGIVTKARKDRRSEVVREVKFPIANFNDPKQRNIFFLFTTGTIILLMLVGLGTYEGFHYTETTTFCGTQCHSVMEPEYVAYQHSSHARVACVDCHIGGGASWTVKSKLSGLYQVYSVTFNKYKKPIETPIHNLRPARETCEECHWPEKFYSRQLVLEKHYLADEVNTEWDINLQMKTGPEHSGFGLTEGIHWHINPDIKVEYISTDPKREQITWIRYTNNETGEETIFQEEGLNYTPEQFDTLEVRTMDCLDCHNRPSHNYKSPMTFINTAISAGIIPQDLPEIKMLALEIMGGEYPTKDSALLYIETYVDDYYKSSHPDIYNENKSLVEMAVNGLKSEFSKNIFPEMNVNWKAYPNHIGHLEFNGCFRCHNEQHSDQNGKTISMDCDLCHTIVGQGVPDTLQVARYNESLEFVHPNDPDQYWKEMLCVDCHSGLY